MQKSVAKYLNDAATELGLECDLIEDYSGRGMFGDKTIAVKIDHDGFYQIIAIAAMRVKEDEDERSHHDVDEDERIDSEDFVTALGELQVDTLGKRGVVYY